MDIGLDVRLLTDLFRTRCQVQPDLTCHIFGDRSSTYKDFDCHSNQIANGLNALGAKPITRVGFIGKNSDNFFELLLGALKARVVLVPVNWRLAPPEIATILLDAEVEFLFVGNGFGDLAASLVGHGFVARALIGFDLLEPGALDFLTWRDSQSASDPNSCAQPDDTAVQIYTSGTTGLPKGVELSHRNILAFLRDYDEGCFGGLGDSDVFLICLPNFHVAGMFVGLAALAYGCTSVIMEEVNIGLLLSLIERHQVTFVFLVPAVILAVVNHPTASEASLRSLRRLVYGASPIAEDTLLRARKLVPRGEFWQVYGSTESCATGTCLRPEDHNGVDAKLRSCGKPYPAVDIRIEDPEGNSLPQGEVGEIIIMAEAVMKGYWRQPAATRSALISDGRLRTGDAGYFDNDGFLYIHDRLKDMIITGAENVYPAEVENALFACPAVADAAVIGIPDERWGEAVKAIVVVRQGYSISANDIISFVRSRIAGFKAPKSVDFVEALPRNPSGKVLRRDLREPFWAGKERRVG